MLRAKSRYAEHHNVHITDDAVRAAVTLSRRYLTGASCRTRRLICSTPPRPRAHEPRYRTGTADHIRSQITALEMEKQALLEDIAMAIRAMVNA
jgi:type VI secretion system protein VasG